MKIYRHSLLLVSTLMLFGCTQGPDFKAPAVPQTKSYLSKDELSLLNQKIELGKKIQTQWWEFFQSKELNTLIEQTVKNNYDLTAAKETLEQAKEAVKAKDGSFLPQISAGVTAGRQQYGVATFGLSDFKIPPFSYYEAGLSASWSPDIFGGQKRERELQKALEKYQMHEVDALYITLTGNTASLALNIASLQAEILTCKEIIKEDKEILRLVERSHNLGEASKIDVLNARRQLDADEAMLPPLKQNLSINNHALSILTGNKPADWIAPDLDFHNFSLPQKIPLVIPSELVKNRPDILAAQANLHAASAAVGIATANFYPKLTLSANMLLEALEPKNLFNLSNNAWSLAAGLATPIFNGGTLTAQKHEAQHAYKASLAQYQQTILVAFKEVADALTSLAHDDEEISVLKDALSTANASLNITRASYQAGTVSLLEIDKAQQEAARAQLNIIYMEHQRYLDYIRLFVVLGGSPMPTKKYSFDKQCNTAL